MYLGIVLIASLAAALPAPDAAAAPPPDDFEPNTKVGPGGKKYKDSAHFRVWDAPSDAVADRTIGSLEAGYACFVGDLGWRSPGLSFRQENDDGPFYKLNVYTVGDIPGASANTGLDETEGLSFLNVVTKYLTEPSVTVHEFGHAMTYAARYWIYQKRTGAWWETVANFVADTYLTSAECARARDEHKQAAADTLIDLGKTISDSYQVIVDGTQGSGNYYQAWPFLTYMFNNPDNYTGLGHSIFPNVWNKYARDSNETPLHVLDRLVAPLKIQTVVGRYWARMAYVDIGHAKARAKFNSDRAKLNYANVSPSGSGVYRPRRGRQPRYMGANIIPLKGTGDVSVNVTATGGSFIATLAVRGSGGSVRYVDLKDGQGREAVAEGEEASLVVVNAPDKLVLFDPFELTNEVNKGLDYQVQITGATA